MHVGSPQPPASAESRHPASIAFHRILREMGELHDKKQRDYGRATDPFANVRASADFGVEGWVGCMIRANDKMRRIQTFAQKGELANESVEDSLLDLAVYAVIGLVLYREESHAAPTPASPSINDRRNPGWSTAASSLAAGAIQAAFTAGGAQASLDHPEVRDRAEEGDSYQGLLKLTTDEQIEEFIGRNVDLDLRPFDPGVGHFFRTDGMKRHVDPSEFDRLDPDARADRMGA